jgi:hypothetical protein
MTGIHDWYLEIFPIKPVISAADHWPLGMTVGTRQSDM